jgi:protein MYSM1
MTSKNSAKLTKPIAPIELLQATPSRPVTITSTPKQSTKKPKRPVYDELGEEELGYSAELFRKLASSSARRRKIRTEDGDWIDPVELEGRTIDHQPPPPPEPKRKRKYTRKVDEDPEDPFRLIWLNDYSVEADADEDEKAPFRVEIDISVLCLLDFHSHLFSTEIIGLLGGSFDAFNRLMQIRTAFPCQSSHSTGTEVDVDPLSEMEAGEHFERSGVRMIGWYHSHPNFEPNPSLRDLETQTMYQGLCRSVDGGFEAFVGVIVNPYLAVTESSSHIECFYVAQSSESGLERLPFRLPIQATGVLNQELLLEEMRKLLNKASTASDALDMQKNAERGVKRVEKVLRSLSTHAQVEESHPYILKVRQLFAALGSNVLERTEEDYSF